MNYLRFGTFNSGRDKLVLWDQITLRSEMKRSHNCVSHVIKMFSHITRRTGCTKVQNEIETQLNGTKRIQRNETKLRNKVHIYRPYK